MSKPKPFSLIVIVLLAVCKFVYAQEKEVVGIVKNKLEEPVPYANIVINEVDSIQQSFAYGYTDDRGHFSIEIPQSFQVISINVTAIGYQEKSIKINLIKNDKIIIELEESITQLQEVIVKAKKNEDILDLDISNMNLSKKNTLRDVLDKTEGIIVGEEGAISYQGKQINKILINGKEVFVNQNKMALDNLDYEIMDRVQIIDNYKDKFTIDFNRIRDPVINVDTKSEFKGVLKEELSAGYGFKDKYSFLGKGFFFSDKFNAFVTTHTNNIGEKEFNQKEVLASVTTYATTSLNETFQPFFINDEQTRKNFVSNSSLTFRWQGDNSKTGIVAYHGRIHTEKENNYKTFVADTLIEKSRSENVLKGDFIAATLNYNHFISSNTVLQNELSTLMISQKKVGASTDTLFIPDETYLMQENLNTSKNFTFSNNLKLTHLLGDKIALDLDFNYYYEKFSRDREAKLSSIDTANMFQEELASKSFSLTQGTFKFNFKKVSLNTSFTITNNKERGSLKDKNNSNEDADLNRNITTIELPFYLSGGIKKFDYQVLISPILIIKNQDNNQKFLKMSHNLTYKIESQNKLGLGFSRDYNFYELSSLYDTIAKDYNHVVVNNNRNNLENFSTNEELVITWFNNNVARSKSFHIIYRYNQKQNFLQSVLDSISNNRFFYSNRIFDRNQTHTLSTGGRKGFYIGEEYHRLTIGGDLNIRHNYYTTAIVNNMKALAEMNSWKPGVEISFAPRDFFINELNNRSEWNHLFFTLDSNEINRQYTFTNTFSVKGFGDKINWNFDFIYRNYSVNNENFDVPDANLSFQFDVTERISFSIKGQSILTLFNLNNYNFENTISDGNTVTQISTNNNLGYLIFYTSLKF